MYEPPAVVEEPAVSVFVWWPWPLYEVEHRYVVENEHVTIRDDHYFSSYGRSRTYIRNDRGQHRAGTSTSTATDARASRCRVPPPPDDRSVG